jgi:alpha-tubulin suppressor-like RCC1 family protein
MVAAGQGHVVALQADGTVMAWGNNARGQLGDGTTTNRLSPVAVPGLTGVVAVSAGSAGTVALKANGTVMAWGWNDFGQLGDGTTTASASPVQVLGLTGVVAVSTSGRSTVALKSDGTVAAWGANFGGELGDGTTTNRSSPVMVPWLTGVVAVSAGLSYTVALKSDGTMMAWGYNDSGQLGDGTTTNRLSPAAVPGLNGVVAVAAGYKHTVVLKADGTVMAWGWNGYGQLGDGTTTDRLSPVAVQGLTRVLAASTGAWHTVALKADGTVMAWGDNSVGELGDGTTTDRLSPVAVPGLTGVAAVAAGGPALDTDSTPAYTVALKSDGMVMAWGNNGYGQLGDGTTTQRLSPVAVGGLNLGVVTTSASLSPTLLTFDAQNLGSPSAAQTLTLTNTGNNFINIASIFASGDYARTTTCGATLAPGANCTISVTFTPVAAGTRNGGLAIIGNGSILNSVILNGTGAGPSISLSSTSLSYAGVNLGTTSTAQTVTLSNTGNAVLNIASIAASGDYAVTHNCGTGLGISAFCTLSITFTPTATGTRTGTVTITDDAFDSPQRVSLTGNGQGAVVSLSATAVTFGSQGVGTTSTAQSITLTNTGGAVLNISSIVASGDFARTTTCGATLAAGANCTINVTFTPTAVGAQSGSLTITDDAAGSPNTISLSGAGAATPVVTLNPTTLTFATQSIGTTSAAKTIALSNTGGATLSISSIQANGDFTQTNSCGGGLAAGGSCSISVTFTPTVAGPRTGSVSITSNAPGSPHMVWLFNGAPPYAVDIRSYIPAALGSAGYMGFLRVINTGNTATPVTVAVIDENTGAVGNAGTLTTALPAGAAVTYAATDIEQALGAPIDAGSRPRIRVSAQAAVQVQSFQSNPSGVVTLNSGAQSGTSVDVPSYLPWALHTSGYVAYLRIINTGSSATAVSVALIDGDSGVAGTAGTLNGALPPGAAVTYSGQQIEAALGVSPPASARPRIRVTSTTSVDVQSFQSNPGGVVAENGYVQQSSYRTLQVSAESFLDIQLWTSAGRGPASRQ